MGKFKVRLIEFWDVLKAKGGKYQIPARAVQSFIAILLVILGLLVYFYGVLLVLPDVFEEVPQWTLAFRLLGTWLLVAFLSNMYLVRKRNSSIHNRMLLTPTVRPLPAQVPQMDSDVQYRETARHLSEHFTPTPFGDAHNWHICAVCEVFVPPRAWHCHVCQTCVLRRDHHCIFIGGCIGEENQSNFIGLLLYLGIGTTLTSVFCLYYALYFENMSFLWYLFRTTFMFYTFFVDFDIRVILASVCTIGQFPAWGVFYYYITLALKGQTSADAHRKIVRTLPGEKLFSYDNMCKFLGPYPLLRIIWPFHKPFVSDYNPPAYRPEDEPGRIRDPDPRFKIANNVLLQASDYETANVNQIIQDRL